MIWKSLAEQALKRGHCFWQVEIFGKGGSLDGEDVEGTSIDQ